MDKQQIINGLLYAFFTFVASYSIAEGTNIIVMGYWYIGTLFYFIASFIIFIFFVVFTLDEYYKGSGTDGEQHNE